MENFDQQNQLEISGLKQELERERSNQNNVYQIARFVQMLKLRGEEVDLTENEKSSILDNLNTARVGVDRFLLTEQGYEIARWLMLIKTLKLDENIIATVDDQEKIFKAVEKYKVEHNVTHLASLIKTAEVLGLEIKIEDLPANFRLEVEDELKKM